MDINYYNTFISTAPDSPASSAEIPACRKRQSIPLIQYKLLSQEPYNYTQKDVLWKTHIIHKGVKATSEAKAMFFSKGQPCLRSSALAKKYGWGFHFNKNGKVALIPVGSKKYNQLVGDETIKQLVAMRTSRKT